MSNRSNEAACHNGVEQSRIAAGLAWIVSTARDALARLLLKLGLTPNTISVLGVGFTVVAGYYLLRGGSQQWSSVRSASLPDPTVAALWLVLACAGDMLDGAMARVGNKRTALGAVLDSSLDRVSDMLIYTALAVHFAAKANVTYCLLGIVSLGNAMMISYIKARSENLIPSCSVGYWQRGERMVAILVGLSAGHATTLLWMMATLPALTASRRLAFSIQQLRNVQAGRQALTDTAPGRGWARLAFWRYGRGSRPHALVSAIYIAILLFASVPEKDYLGAWLTL